MSLNTSLKGRLRNTNLPITYSLFPLFEAVVNSIHSIDMLKQEKDNYNGKIIIKIIRSPYMITYEGFENNIIGFEIIDNGIGFNKKNYNSFRTLDSEFKMNLGCRGIGRLLWLKAYDIVKIKSTFLEQGKIFLREFDFSAEKEIFNEKTEESSKTDITTSVLLSNLSPKYYKSLPKTVSTIARDLLEHCLWYFIREGGAPDIIIQDGKDNVKLQNEFDSMMLNASEKDSFTLKSHIFEIIHIKIKSTLQNKHSINYAAADRVVKEDTLSGKIIPGLFGYLKEKEDKFSYLCFVTSSFLNDNVNPERLGFNIPETSNNGLYDKEEITFTEIREKTIEKVKNYLEPFLKENKVNSLDRVKNFVDTKAPRYKPILNRISEEDKIVDPNISDKDLEIKLHNHLANIESELIEEGHNILIPSVENEKNYTQKIEDYLSKVSVIKQSDLAGYVMHRKVILDLLSNAINKKKDGKYVKEEIIHKLIMPMQTTSEDIFSEESNLWLIDERLAFHNYLASDKTLNSMPITGSEENKEPDLFALNIYDNPLLVNNGKTPPLASITIVEIKRPMRNDFKEGEDKNPIEQVYGYLKRIRKGNVSTFNGRPIPDSGNIPAFCYIICDITPSLFDKCENSGLEITSDKMGFFGFNRSLNCYIEIISYDRLLNMAKERNKAFFDKLGLPST
jgi:hypothetical protein|nr:hypothetical protein [uncultured Capnocytophaga sp.]